MCVRMSVCVCERMCVSAIFLFCDFNLSIVRHGEQTNDSRLEMPPRQTKRAKGRSGAVGRGGAGPVDADAQGCPAPVLD